jgi:hypothetical protein
VNKQRIISHHPITKEEFTLRMGYPPIFDDVPPEWIRFYCSICDEVFETVWMSPDAPMIYEYEGHPHEFAIEELAAQDYDEPLSYEEGQCHRRRPEDED